MKYIALLVVLIIPSTNCFANLSGPWKPGQLLVDVQGVKDIAIVREKLRIDLRPVEQRGAIKITATYLIEHTQPPKDLPLTFITGVDSVKGVKCTLNGMPLAFTTKQVVTMPDNWKPPAATPGFVPEEELLYSRSLTDTQHEWIQFTVPLQTGRQSIEVTYEVEAGEYYSQYHTAKYWQTAYILAPARTWKSFGGLDLEVLAPDKWQVKSNLPLQNQGQSWTASFDSLPADFISLTTQHPNGKRVFVVGTLQMVYFFGLMTLLLGFRHMASRYKAVRQHAIVEEHPACDRHTSWLLFLCSLLPLFFNAVSIFMDNSNLPSTQNNYQLPVIYLYFQGIFWLVFIAPLMLLSRAVLWGFCRLGTWQGNQFLRKRGQGTGKRLETGD